MHLGHTVVTEGREWARWAGKWRHESAGEASRRYDDGMNRGIYLAILHMPKTQSITIGRFGHFTFSAGDYLYVGSARSNLLARFARHSRRRRQPLAYRLPFRAGRFPRGGPIDAPERMECKMAAALAKLYAWAVPRFGASDCRCGGHLFCVKASRCPAGLTKDGKNATGDAIERFEGAGGWTWCPTVAAGAVQLVGGSDRPSSLQTTVLVALFLAGYLAENRLVTCSVSILIDWR